MACVTGKSGTQSSSLTVNLSITQTGDFLASGQAGNQSFTRGTGTAVAYTIRFDDDSVDEPNGTITCTILPGTGYTVGSPPSDTITIVDNDPTIVSLSRSGSGAVDEGDTAEFTVTLGRALVAGEIVDVPLAISGTAALADWSLALKAGTSINTGVTVSNQTTATPQLRFSGAGAQTATLVLTADNDTVNEVDETVIVALGADGTGTNGFDHSSVGTNVGGGADPHGMNNEFTVTITGDAVTAGFTATTANVFENAGKVSLPVVLSQARNVATNLRAITSSFSATTWADFDGGPFSLTIPAGSTRATLNVPIVRDDSEELHETFTVILTSPPDGIAFVSGFDTVQVTIMELSALTISGGSGVIEGNPAEFTLTVDSTDPAPHIALPVRVRIHQPASAAFVEEDDLGEKTITLPAGQRTFTYRVPTIDDMKDEEDNNIIATLHSGTGYTLPALTDTVPVPGSGLDTNDDGVDDYFERRWKGTAAVMVSDNDEPLPTVNLSVSANAITEGEAALTITATRSEANTSGAALMIPIQVKPTGTTASASDYNVASSITIANNASSGTTAFTVTDDAVVGEPDETVVIELGALPTGTESGTSDAITITITDNDDPPPGTPTVNLSVSANAITEGQAALTITATRSEANTSGSALSIPIQVKTTGTTASASDYTVADSIDIAHNASSGTTSFTVTDDPLDEPDETVVIQLGTLPTGNAHGTLREVTITIADNDVSVVSFSGATYRANEGNPIRVTVNIQPQRSADTQVAITCTPGAATTADYTCPTSVTLDARTGSGSFDIATLEDTQADHDKTFTVTLTPPAGVTAGTRSSATLTIANAGGRVNPPITDPVTPGPTDPTDPTAPVNAIDSPVIPRISIADASATEGEAVMFTVSVQPMPSAPLTIHWTRSGGSVQPGSAQPGSAQPADFTGTANGRISIPAGQTSVPFAIPTTDDFIDEEDETFTITLTDPEDTAVFTTATATGRIVDNDTAGIHIPAAVRIGQPGDTADYSIRLMSQPTAPVQMALTVRDPTVASLNAAGQDGGRIERIFTTADWSEPQVVRITAHTDRGMTRLSHTVTSTDPKYHARTQTLIVRLGQDRSPAISSWLSRFTRTHAEHTLDGIAGRLFNPNPPGLQMQLAGQSMTTGAQPERWSFPGEDAPAHSMTGQEALAGAFFSHSEEPDSDGSLWSSWGRGDWSRFDAKEGAIEIEGEVTSATFGMDQRQGPWLAGLALTHSTGEGDYHTDGTNGQLESTQTTFMPYVSRTLNDQARAWAALGWGQGEMTLQASDEAHRTGIESRMLVAGARGVVLQVPERAGLVLSMGSDALWLRTSSRETDMLEATASELSRLRFRLEGAWRREFGPGIVKNRMDIGLRHDAGGAETGFGAELGAGVSWSDANQILQWRLQGRGLLAHEDDGFEEYGASAQLVFDPAPQTMRGLSLTVQRRQGTATGSNGSDLLTPDTLYNEDDRRFSADMAYGLKAWSRNLLGSPYLRLSGNHSLEETRIGYRVEPGFISSGHTDPPLRLNLDLFTRMEYGQDAEEDFGAGVELRLRW